jgi:signal transduction histidine kinase
MEKTRIAQRQRPMSSARPYLIMKGEATVAAEEESFLLSSLPPSRAQRRTALALVLGVLVVALAVAGPLSGVRLNPVAAFLPMYLMAMFLCDSITATLLFAQFAISRSLANLAIASGYLFSALTIIPYSLTFPGVFAPMPLIGGLQSTAWFFDLWHAGFPLFILAYALLKEGGVVKRVWRGAVPTAIGLSAALTLAINLLVVLFCVFGEKYSPIIILDDRRFSPLFPYYVGAPVVSACILAIIILWMRRRSVLDLWLMVVLWLFVVEMPISYYPDPERFSLGWYAARAIGFLNSSILLIVLLYEITYLYGRLVTAVLAQRREREARLITGDAVAAAIAHEVKQPLTAIVTRANAGFRALDRSPADADKAKAQFRSIGADGERAGAVIDSIRGHFRNDERVKISLDVNDLIRETVAFARDGLQKHGILVKADSNPHKPRVIGDRIQLQQVLLNLITNAIESMAAKEPPRLLCVGSEVGCNGHVEVSVEDTGTGISPQDMARVFNPLYTTKSGGMGMGLSICRSIVEAHEGQLWAVPNTPEGAIFRFTLRADAGTSVATA